MKEIENKIKYQIEDIMISENIDEKESIKFLLDYYSNDDTTVFNKERVIKILNTLMSKQSNL